MGNDQSNRPPHDIQRTMSSMTFDQLLSTVSQKVSKLQEVLSNMKEDRTKKGERVPEFQAAKYLAEELGTAESELSKYKLMLISPVQQQRDREQNLVQERQRHPGNHSKSKEHHGAPRETTSGSKIDVLQIQLGNCKDELSSAQKTLEEVREENKALKANLEGLKADLNDLAKRNENYRKEVQKKDVENGNLLYRLSKLTSDKLTADNPNIADLSDPNRPTKLVEMMSELYDNQWTDAFAALQPLKNDDRLVVKILLHTFMDIYNFCKDKSSSLFSMSEKTMKKLFEDFNATMKEKDRIAKAKSATMLCRTNGKEMAGLFKEQSFDESNTIYFYWEHDQAGSELEESGSFKVAKDVWPKLEWELKKVKKDFGVAMVPIVTKAYLKPRWSKTCVKELKPYIKRCFDVAWMMCVQTPPMALAALPRQGDTFDATLYTAYSKRGNKVNFVVWPAVLLKEKQFGENAAVMRKGVADGKD